ncbi:hypothetical protein H0H81_007602 [Sphagnurus paluster]|uniref:Uncharacterized protein n=1 Tax=Sphagnurus paluster TaxID=117069 RepID=A0A9P7KJ82_9AGAR|nr:hypothetical protein H0H81_007602 [Sphagnurus paluster]
MDTWTTNMCAATPCGNETISTVVQNITTGCASDASVSSALLESLHSAQYIYPTIRKILCLRASGKNCFTQTLINVFSLIGQDEDKPFTATNLSDSNIGALIASTGSFLAQIKLGNSQPEKRSVRFGIRSINQTQTQADPNPISLDSSSSATNMTCTPCMRSATRLILDDFPDTPDDALTGVAGFCSFDVLNPITPGVTKAVSINSSAGLRLPQGWYWGLLASIFVSVSAVALG